MNDVTKPQQDYSPAEADDLALEPVNLGAVSDLTGDSGSGGGDRDNIVWGMM